ncbi:19428_t:CDS:2 [Funneliformis geosporum]|nr:19428_t:CDS:2 [Funneliformis geosporum]
MVAININEILGSYGGSGGYPGNDLKVIFKGVGGKDKQILNIKVVEIRVRHGSVIDSLQFVYKVKTDEKEELVEGIKYGGNGGKLDTITIDHEGGKGQSFVIPVEGEIVLFGKSGGLLDSLGIYIVEGMSKIQQISQNTSADYQQIKMALAK